MLHRAQAGFSIVAAIFIVVVLAALAAALLTVASLQHSSAGLDVQGVRAYQAARTGIEWGLFGILDADISAALPDCTAATGTVTPAGALGAFAVTVTCSAPPETTELSRSIRVYSITAIATFGSPNQPNHVSREVTATVSRCRDPGTPTFEC
jgi:MSHA biogenesis protein MshP